MEANYANIQNPDMFNLGELLEACRKNDHKAQFQIYRLFYKTMFNICLSIINDPCVAEDIMQESFLKAFETIETYNGSESFDNWLGRMVLNRATDFRNRNNSLFFNW
jgi:RNA polymerase sigma-70 factor (ECF subfamily)